MIHFITVLAVLQWSRAKPAVSPVGACTRFIALVWNRTCVSGMPVGLGVFPHTQPMSSIISLDL